jgi:apolipoprotein N-acyltransferase
MMSVFTSVTFLIDRIYSQKVKGIISSFVFPSVYVIMEYIVVLTNPSGSYGTLAHTQSNLPLLQIISITGIWGITFLIMWTASVINWLWDNSFEREKIFLVMLVYGIPFIVIILYGQIRLSTETKSNTVRIASINISKTSLNKRYDAMDKIIEKDCQIRYCK